MPNLFPALLGATALCISTFQFNDASAQTVITNGTTVGQQLIVTNGSILVEQGGFIQDTELSGIDGSGNNLTVDVSGDVETTIATTPITPLTPIAGIAVDGDNATIEVDGSVTLQVLESIAGTTQSTPAQLDPLYAAIHLDGNQNTIENNGNISAALQYSSAASNVLPGCTNGVCLGTSIADIVDGVYGAAIIGNNNVFNNFGTVVLSTERATHQASAGVALLGNNNTIQNFGTITLDKADTAAFSHPDPRFVSGNVWASGSDVTGNLSSANFYPDAAVLMDGVANTLINHGQISVAALSRSGTTTAISAYWGDQTNTIITNLGLIENQFGTGVFARNAIITNSGLIRGADGPSINGTASPAGVYMFNSSLFNSGTISHSTDSGVAIGSSMVASNPQYSSFPILASSVENHGTISGAVAGILAQQVGTLTINNTGLITTSSPLLGSGVSADVGGGSVNKVIVNNSGRIFGDGSGVSFGISNSGTITNSGEITGNRNGVLSDSGGDRTILNTGSIFGETGLNFFNGSSIALDNSGALYSTLGPTGYAILVSPEDGVFPGFTLNDPTDDEITFRSGTRIIGRMYMGADSFFATFDPTLLTSQYNGNDIITLDRTSPDIAWRWTFDNFDLPGQDPFDAGGIGDSLFILGNNVPYYIWNGPVTNDYGPFPSEGGITVYIPNISGIFAANGIMEDIARTVHGGIRNRLNEGWDHENLPQDLFYRGEDDIVLRDGSDLIGAPLDALDPAVFRKAPPLTVWAKGFGGIRNQTGTDNYGDYSHLWMGGMAGLDLRSSQGDENDDGLRDTEDDDHWNIGILGGYVQSDLSFASGFKDIQSDFFFAGAYGRLVRNALYLDASVIGGFGGMSEYGPIANNLVPGGIENPGEGYSTDGRFISPSASIGKRFYITDTISFTPEINATYLAQWIDGSTSALTLSIEDRFIDTVFGHVQGSVKKVIKRDDSTIIGELRGGLYMSRQLHGDETNLSVVSNQFTIDTSREDVVSPYVGLGATWEIANNFKLSADGEMDFGDLDGGRVRFGASLGF